MFEFLKGRELFKIYCDDSKEILTLEFGDGSTEVFRAQGNCCSHTWIEHLEIPPDIAGAVITEVKDCPDPTAWDNHVCDNECGHDVLAVYQTNLHTTKGTIAIEYRNDSNGYYGGWLEHAT